MTRVAHSADYPIEIVSVISTGRVDIRLQQTLTARLAAIGYDIADVRTVVLSHLHQHIDLPGLGHPDLAVLPAHDPAAGTCLSASPWGMARVGVGR
jgi:hypothetical protein